MIEYEPRYEKKSPRGPTYLYYLCSEDIGTDQLRSNINHAFDLRLCLRIYISKSRFSHDAAHIIPEIPELTCI